MFNYKIKKIMENEEKLNNVVEVNESYVVSDDSWIYAGYDNFCVIA